MKIKLTKLAAVENPLYPTPEKDDYKPGQDNGNVSLPVDYEILGEIEKLPEIGDYLIGRRTHRNGVEFPGYFRTSKITYIKDFGELIKIETRNSVYCLEVL